MPSRLVYTPKVWVYTKDSSGNLLDLTRYVVGGEVKRLVDQVSTAQVRLRNPGKIFTDPKNGVAFHPMDPITIFLQRIENHPVRVFTGFLDKTPYYPLYPGVITLQASCTLKKLLYTYWNPALPYVYSLLTQYGWIRNHDGTIVASEAYSSATKNEGNLVPFSLDGKGNVNDGSIGKLLFEILRKIGEWREEKVWIEGLPDAVPTLMAALMRNVDTEQEVAATQWNYFTEKVIGSGGYGSGGSQEGKTGVPTGSVAGLDKIVPIVERIANKYNVPLEMVLATMYVETGMSNQDSAGNMAHTGWFQCQNKESGGNPPYAYGPWSTHVPTVAETHDLGMSCNAFCAAAAGWANSVPSLRSSPYLEWAMKVQGVTGENNPRYPETWAQYISIAKQDIAKFGGKSSDPKKKEGITEAFGDLGGAFNQVGEAIKGHSDKSGKGSQSGMNHYEAIVAAANEIASKEYSYVYGAGHNPQYAPDNNAYDCSGSVSACLHMAGYDLGGAQISTFFATWGDPGPDPGERVTIYANPDHVFMKIGKRYWGTAAEKLPENPKGGAGWIPGEPSQEYLSKFTAVHPKGLNEPANVKIGGNSKIPGGEGVGGSGPGEGGSMMSTATAVAFSTEIDFPGIEEMVESTYLKGQKALMLNKPLLPFIQQLTQASLRKFQSLPNGDFFAFYPDYFGEMGHRKPYWNVDDVEILNGGIYLSDDSLATHVYCVGDNTWPASQELMNKLFSAGTVTIFNAFLSEGFLDRSEARLKHLKQNPGLAKAMDQGEAIAFIERYGARPEVLDMPMIRSPLYEMLLAYQQFLKAWSNQFATPFEFTFMPEIYPGGKIGFPTHGLQMYVEAVTHTWDLSEGGGFTTTAQLSSPSVLEGAQGAAKENLPPNMVSALVEPVKGATMKSNDKGHRTEKSNSTPALPPIVISKMEGHRP